MDIQIFLTIASAVVSLLGIALGIDLTKAAKQKRDIQSSSDGDDYPVGQ